MTAKRDNMQAALAQPMNRADRRKLRKGGGRG
jgi:hypothetical protein